ncbi:MAG: PQQ-binding-like beta-propeller repeat protein [Candidatus Hydrogenedentota bacterium]
MPQLQNKKPEFVPDQAKWRIAVVVAAVAGIFTLVLAALLIINYLQIRAVDPLDNPELLKLREQLAASPGKDEELVKEIRTLDLLVRKAFFTSQTQLRLGGQLLLASAVVFLIAFRLAARWRPRMPRAQEGPSEESYWDAIARSKELITGIAIILVLVTLTAAYMTPTDVPLPGERPSAPAEIVAEDTPGTEEPEAFPTWDEMLAQWPSFRGPGGYGVAHFTTAPMQWDIESGKGIRWKVETPRADYNSPVVWGDRLFISGATEEEHNVYCYDTETGELVWNQALPAFPGSPAEPPRVTEDTGYAAPTMAVHGERAFAIFATGDIACYDFEGNLVWGRNLGVPQNHYGHASSLIAFEDKLYVQLDDTNQPRLLALDTATGEEVWMAERTYISWASPACPPTPFGFQLILASERDVDGYDPQTGELLWTEEGLDGEVAPSPAISGDTVFVANEYAMATAVRLSAPNDTVQSEILWQWEQSLPEVSSPTSSDAYFYFATSLGEFICLDKETGEEVWFHEFDQGFYSSPIRIGDRIYVADLQGTMNIFGTGEEFELLGALELGEPVYATPAYLDHRMYVRTEQHLLCIEGHDGN